MSRTYTDEHIVSAFGLLLRHIRHLSAQTEALRYLCEKHGAFDHAEYERVVSEGLTQWDQSVDEAARKALEVANDATLQQLLKMPTDKFPKH